MVVRSVAGIAQILMDLFVEWYWHTNIHLNNMAIVMWIVTPLLYSTNLLSGQSGLGGTVFSYKRHIVTYLQ